MLNLQFKKVRLVNFGPYVDSEIALENKGFCLVTGENHCKKDNALSNGSGKSFIWSGVCYALTGETIGGFRTNLANVGSANGEMRVILEFRSGSDSFSIDRGQRPAKYLNIVKNGEDVSGKTFTESVAKLEALLPELTRELIATSIILGQGMPLKFSSFSPSGRKELLEKLTKSDYMIEDVKSRVATRAGELARLQRGYDDSILVNKTQMASSAADSKKAQDELDSLVKPDFGKGIAECDERLAKLAKDKADAEGSESSFREEESKAVAELLKATTEKAAVLAEEATSYSNATRDMAAKAASLETKISGLEREIRKLKSVTDVCPVCGQKLQGVEKPHTEAHEAELAEVRKELAETNERLREANEKHRKYQAEIEKSYSGDIARLTALRNAATHNAEAAKKAFRAAAAEESAAKANRDRLAYESANWDKKVDALKARAKSGAEEAARLEGLIRITSLASEENAARIAIVKKMDTLIKRDFRGYLLANIIAYLDSKAKDYSEIVFGTRDLVLEIDGNALNISYCGKLMDNLSGGEKTRVDLILQLALREMLQKYLGFNSNILVLDEVTDFLDKKSCKAVMSLLESELSSVESVFVISHHAAELELSIDSELKVVKGADGNSSIL